MLPESRPDTSNARPANPVAVGFCMHETPHTQQQAMHGHSKIIFVTVPLATFMTEVDLLVSTGAALGRLSRKEDSPRGLQGRW